MTEKDLSSGKELSSRGRWLNKVLDNRISDFYSMAEAPFGNGQCTFRILELLPEEALRAATKGFLAGMYGPKKYEANSWKTLDSRTMVKERLAALRRHLDEVENDKLDPDTGLENNEIFLLTNAIMIAYHRMKLRGEA